MAALINSFNQTAILFCFMIIGYVLKKKKVLPDNAGAVFSKAVFYVFLPALVFKVFATQLTVANVKEKGSIIIMGTILLAALFVVSLLLSRIFASDTYGRNIYLYSFILSNYGYLGYALMLSMFGDEMLLDMMIFALPFSVFIHTAGLYMLMPKGNISFKMLINPVFIALFGGAVIGLTGIPVPQVVFEIAKSASACMAPVAMMLTGFIIGGSSFKILLSDFKVFPASLLRLIIIPGLVVLFFYLADVPSRIIVIAGLMMAMPMGLNTIIIPEAFGEDSLTGARLAFVSSALGIVTIPVILSMLAKLPL